MPDKERLVKKLVGRRARLKKALEDADQRKQGGAATGAIAAAPDAARQPTTPANRKRRHSPSPDGRGHDDTEGGATADGKAKSQRKNDGGRAARAAGRTIYHSTTIPPPPEFETPTWGLKPDPAGLLVEVCLRFRRPGPGDGDGGGDGAAAAAALECFSVRLVPNSTGDDERRRPWKRNRDWCSTGEEWSEANHGCEALDNFLIYSVSKRLHAAAWKKGRLSHRGFSETKAADLVVRVVRSDPGRACAVCDKSFGGGVKLWRPTPCSAPCKVRMREEIPLAVRVSPLLVDYRVLDFLLGCVYSCCCSPPESVARPSTLSWAGVNRAVKYFPAMDDSSIPRSVVNFSTARARQEREALLSWLATEFQGCLVSASSAATVKYITEDAGIEPATQFILLNSTLEREAAFQKRQTSGLSVFHATPAYNIFPLVVDGLRRRPGGASGISFAGSFETSSLYYQKGYPFRPWPRSIFAGSKGQPELVFGAEVRGVIAGFGLDINNAWSNRPHAEDSTLDQSQIALRYVFLSNRLHPSKAGEFLPGSQTREVMEDTFHSIKTGEIAHLEDSSDPQPHRERWIHGTN
ncbi:hypothetical protein RB601_007913 [Gaeumannomyces tritici]